MRWHRRDRGRGMYAFDTYCGDDLQILRGLLELVRQLEVVARLRPRVRRHQRVRKPLHFDALEFSHVKNKHMVTVYSPR